MKNKSKKLKRIQVTFNIETASDSDLAKLVEGKMTKVTLSNGTQSVEITETHRSHDDDEDFGDTEYTSVWFWPVGM